MFLKKKKKKIKNIGDVKFPGELDSAVEEVNKIKL